ncbi:MAG: hypothetical protein JNJ78_10055 [Anaerolineae bacterium]|nr:hypothetical protein [Anaerolineae bacterium]
MSKITTNGGRWKPGQSGNPKGRAPGSRALREILRLKGEEPVLVGGVYLSAQEALAEAVWRFALTGEVKLAGKALKADTVNDWVQAVKWLYSYVAPAESSAPAAEPEMVVRVVRVERQTED